MAILIADGYNVIHALPSMREALEKGLENARKAVVKLCSDYARRRGFIKTVKVVFDGRDEYRDIDPISSHSGTQVFSRTGKGDDKVIEMVKVYCGKSRIIVVSNDNYVRNNSRVYGAEILDVKELLNAKKRPASQKIRGEKKTLSSSVCDKITREYREKLGL
jgi:predicted RNA-binding protein with PIN domain